MKFQIILTALLILLAACSQVEDPMPTTTTTTAVVEEVEDRIEQNPTLPATNIPEVEALATIEPRPTETAVSAIAPITVTYFTPSQQEGPYYPVTKPEDRDNDLVVFVGATGLPNGQILMFDGTVYDANGMPLEDVTIEIWQTDAAGVYLHPGDPDTDSRDPNFQFYGEAVTDATGFYSFRTIFPGQYEPRPRHIHVKVKLDGQELLTTQFYFAGEIDLQGDDAAMFITTEPDKDADGNAISRGKRNIILNFTRTN